MLILAGVSLNAIVGDNGIITSTQKATISQSCAVLEEYLQQEYVKRYDDNNYGNGLTQLINSDQRKYLQIAQNSCLYFLDPTTYEKYYFINKSQLPDDIKESIRGGETILTGVYLDSIDLYGVTSDLKVYYVGKDEIIGNTGKADAMDLEEVVFDSRGDATWVNTLGITDESGNSKKDITLRDIRSVTELNLKDSSIDFSKLSYFNQLKILTLTDLNKDSLEGIDKCKNLENLFIVNCSFNDYSAIRSLSKLTRLYLTFGNDSIDNNQQLKNLCDSEKGIGGVDFNSLTYFGFWGYYPIWNNPYPANADWDFLYTYTSGAHKSNVTDISCLDNLSQVTKEKIYRLIIPNNQLSSLEGIRNFKNVHLLRINDNNLSSLSGLENMSKLAILEAYNNHLGENDTDTETVLSSINKQAPLGRLELQGNNIKNLSYIINFTSLHDLFLKNNPNIMVDTISSTISIINKCASYGSDYSGGRLYSFNIDEKYNEDLINGDMQRLDLSGKTIKLSTLENYANMLTKLNYLNLNNIKITNDSGQVIASPNTSVNTTLNKLIGNNNKISALGLYGISYLTDMNFAENTTVLYELDIRGTSITDLTKLNAITSIRQLWIDNSEIDLTTIQETINRLSGGEALYDTGWGTWGLYISGNASLATSLSQCKEITYLKLGRQSGNIDLDLSACENLRTLHLGGAGFNSVKLPSGLTKFIGDGPSSSSCGGVRQMPNFEVCKDSIVNISVELLNNASDFQTLVDKLNGSLSLVTLSVLDRSGSCIKAIPANINLPKLTSFTITYPHFENLFGFETANLPALTTLNVTDSSKFNSVSGIEYLKDTITSVNFSGNKLQDIYSLQYLKLLSYCNLNNNNLYDITSTTLNDEKITYKPLEIIKNIHKTNEGKLEYIYVSNNNFTDFTMISDLSWRGKGGF